MLFNNLPEVDRSGDNVVNGSIIADTLLFDFDSKTFPIVDGSPVIVSGMDSVAEFIKTIAHVDREKKAIYDADFGADLKKLIGKRNIDGFEVSQLFNRISESVKKCEAIDSIEDFDFNDGVFSFTVLLKDGETVTQEIDLGVF